jgi:hypothetical protein
MCIWSFGIFNGHFCIFYGHLEPIFSLLDMLYQEKSGNPVSGDVFGGQIGFGQSAVSQVT